MMNQAEDMIKISNLDFSYESGKQVLSNVNLRIKKDELTCIVGPNGGGKTTLLNLILGLLVPDYGTIAVLGEPPLKARQRIGYMPQYFSLDQNFPITALEVVVMGKLHSSFWGSYSKADKRAAHDALAKIDLAHCADLTFSELSGGQRQRVLIARALATEPELLLLDEPTASVDPEFQDEFYTMLSMLRRNMGIVIVSHDISFVSRHVDSVLCVNHEVHVHPTTTFDNTPISEIYNHGVNLIRHDRCTAEGHSHDHCNVKAHTHE
ncbi:MAG: ABC transporter ATP-binding protein [Victivallaceae bacterium]|nr:ABC transporter ATP-binding protein [Victivallaceae bacterium]